MPRVVITPSFMPTSFPLPEKFDEKAIPPLPGVETKGRICSARDRASWKASGPTYNVQTMQSTDAAIIQLAYLYPMTAENISAFLWMGFSWMDSSGTASLADKELERAFIEPIYRNVVFRSSIDTSKPFSLLVQTLQSVAQATLLTVADRGESEHIPIGFLIDIADIIGSLYQSSRHLNFSLPPFKGKQITRREYQEWLKRFGDPFSEGVVSAKGFDWISDAFKLLKTGGRDLKNCPRCQRLFVRGNNRQRFCSEHCRAAFFATEKRLASKINKR